MTASKELTHSWKGLREHLAAIIFTLASSGVQVLFLYQMTVAYGDAFPLAPYDLSFYLRIPLLFEGMVPLRLNPYLTVVPLGVVVAQLATWRYAVNRMAAAALKPRLQPRKPPRLHLSLPRWRPRLGFPAGSTLRSGGLVLGCFTTLLFLPYLITSPLVFPTLKLIQQTLPEPLQAATYQVYAAYVKPLRTLDPAYKFLLSQNLSVLITALLSHILTWARR